MKDIWDDIEPIIGAATVFLFAIVVIKIAWEILTY